MRLFWKRKNNRLRRDGTARGTARDGSPGETPVRATRPVKANGRQCRFRPCKHDDDFPSAIPPLSVCTIIIIIIDRWRYPGLGNRNNSSKYWNENDIWNGRERSRSQKRPLNVSIDDTFGCDQGRAISIGQPFVRNGRRVKSYRRATRHRSWTSHVVTGRYSVRTFIHLLTDNRQTKEIKKYTSPGIVKRINHGPLYF